ncbi:hypothetical protein [Virgibacillus sp. JSM 102003]|uniref:hypothetical protein n=1 Tax=Virgibacillus sp. JSM 102003 TaxID=1562108 RepID=UPI0035C0109A
MKKIKEYKGYWSFAVFTSIVGLIVGIFSVISDHLPYVGEEMTVFEFFISYLAVMINSLPMWFILAMLVGYLFGRNIKQAILFGAIYTITAITFYFVIGHFYTDVPVPVSFSEQAVTYMIWYGASAVGGSLGGGIGYLFKINPYALLILLAGLIFQLFLYGTRSWFNIVGAAQNVTFCLIIVSIVIYLHLSRKRKVE